MTAFPAATWTRPPRQRSGVLSLGILTLVASTWLLVPQALVLWDALVLGIGAGDVVEQGASAAVPATLVLAVGAVASRIAWLLVLAIPVLAAHGLVLVVVAIVAGASGASGVAVLAHLGDGFALLLCLVAVIVALVATAAARAGDRREGASWYAALVLAGVAALLVVATPYLTATPQSTLPTFVADTVVVGALVVVALVAGLRSPAARWTAAALAALTALWIVLLETVMLPMAIADAVATAVSAPIAIAVVRAVLLVLAGALIALSTRWLAKPSGIAPPIVPARAPRTPPVAPPAVAAPTAAGEPVAVPATVQQPQVHAATPAASAPASSAHAPGVAADADAALDQGDRETPDDAPPPAAGPSERS